MSYNADVQSGVRVMYLIYNTLEGCMFLALQTLNVSQILYPHTF